MNEGKLKMCEQCIKEGFPCGKCENIIDASESAIDALISLRDYLTDIHSRATRKDRATSLKKYLIWDLEYIAEQALEAIRNIDKQKAN